MACLLPVEYDSYCYSPTGPLVQHNVDQRLPTAHPSFYRCRSRFVISKTYFHRTIADISMYLKDNTSNMAISTSERIFNEIIAYSRYLLQQRVVDGKLDCSRFLPFELEVRAELWI